MLIPFNAAGLWFEAVQVGTVWRVMIHDNGTDSLFDLKAYNREEAEHIAMINNRQLHMKGIK